MEEQLSALEERVRLAVDLCLRLRAENDDLRQRSTLLRDENQRLAEKITDAKERLQGLLEQIPE